MSKNDLFRCATALLMTASTAVLSVGAYAQTSATPGKKGITKISFKEAKAPDIVKAYPFLKGYIETVGDPSEQKAFPPQAFIAEVPDVTNNIKFLFMYLNTADYCSESGCQLLIYADRGKGYETVLAPEVFEPLYLLTKNGKIVFTHCMSKPRGRAEWTLIDSGFRYDGIKTDASFPDLPACSKPR